MPTLVLSTFNQARTPEDNMTLGSILDDLFVSTFDLDPFSEFDGVSSADDFANIYSVVEHLLNNGEDFTLTVQIPSSFTATNQGSQISPNSQMGGKDVYILSPETMSSTTDIIFESFVNDDSSFDTNVALSVSGSTNSSPDIIDFGQINFTTEIYSVPDTPIVEIIDTPDGLPAQSDTIQYIGEFTISSTDASESLWFDVTGVPVGAEIYTLDENGNQQFKFDPVPTNNMGGTEIGSHTQSINAPSAAISPQTIRVGMVYNGITLPDDLNLAIRGRSIEGESIGELGLDAASAFSPLQFLDVETSPTQVAIAFSDNAAINENSDSLLNLLANVEITGDYSDYPAIASPENLAELLQELESIGLPFSVELTPDSGTVKDSQNSELPTTNGVYLIDETNSPLDDLTVELPEDSQVTVKVTIPDLSNNATGQTNDLTFGSATGEVDTLRVADKPILTVDINDDLGIDKNDPNPLVEIGDYEVQPGDDEEISLVVDSIPPNSSLVILDDDGEVQATFTPSGGSFTADINDTLQGTLAVQFNDPVSELDDFALNLQAIATEPLTNLSAASDPFIINVDLPDIDDTGGTEPLLTYDPETGTFNFQNGLGATLSQELLSDGDSGLSDIGLVITDGLPQDAVAFPVPEERIASSGVAVFSVLPDGTIVGNQERLMELSQDTGNIHFFKVNSGTVDDVIDGRLNSDAIDFNFKVTPTDNGYTLKWTDGLKLNIDLNQEARSPLSIFQGQHEGELLVSPTEGETTLIVNIDSWADYDNSVGLIAIEDSSGTITDPLSGAILLPGDPEYATVALEHHLFFVGEAGDNKSILLTPGTIYMPFIVADATVSDFLGGDNVQAYFPFISANSDGLDHVRLLGDNTFAFEDLHGGGDQDFNDIVIKFAMG